MNWNIDQVIDIAKTGESYSVPRIVAEYGDKAAHKWSIRVMQSGIDVQLSGTVNAYVFRKDGVAVSVQGTIDGSTASVVFPQEAYAVPGQVRCIMRIVTSSETTTIGQITFTVAENDTGVVVDPGTPIQDYDDLVAAIEDMETQTQRAKDAADGVADTVQALVYGADMQTEINKSTCETVSVIVSGDGSFATGTSYVVQVTDQEIFRIRAGVKSAYLAFLKAKTTSGSPSLCDGETGRRQVSAGNDKEFEIPIDCRYIYVTKSSSSTTYDPAYIGYIARVYGDHPINARVKAIEDTMPITGLKYYAIGDSITRGMYANEGASSGSGPTNMCYARIIADINRYELVNLGVSGSGYVNRGGNENTNESGNTNGVTVVTENSFTDADIITIFYGINDYKGTAQNVHLGTMESEYDAENETVIGNMKKVIETLITKAPKAQIIVLLPMNQNRFKKSGGADLTEAANWSFGYAFREGKTLADYREAIRECAEHYNVKVVDAEEVCPINRLNIRSVLGDGLHPTEAMHKRMGAALAPYIH